jgi:hypothetical protein
MQMVSIDKWLVIVRTYQLQDGTPPPTCWVVDRETGSAVFTSKMKTQSTGSQLPPIKALQPR